MSELQDNVALAFRQWNEQREQIAALEAQNQQLREALKDAGHMCAWALQRDISEQDKERVIAANMHNFATVLAATEPKEKV